MPDSSKSAPEPRAKYADLLKDKDVRRWHDNMARGSPASAEICLRNLGRFCSINKLTPKQLAQMNPRPLEDLLMDYVSSVQAKHSGSYIHNTIKIVKSWLTFNGIELKRKIKITGAHETPTLTEERIPTQEELKRTFLSATKQARVACALIAHAGLRLESIGNFQGNDGLKIRDLPELTIKDNQINYEKRPTMLVVRANLSKARHQYFTFLTDEACDYLKDYLEERIRDGEKLTPETAIVVPKIAEKPFIKTINISDMIRKALRGAGLQWRPYVLRSYFDTQLMVAESKGLVIRDYRQYWMGHKGDIENRYTTNKHRLPPDLIEGMRESYKRSQPYLMTTKPEVSEDKLIQAVKKQILAQVLNEKEISKIDLANATDEELNNLLRQKLTGANQNNGATQKVITANEVDQYISQGWEYVTQINGEKFIVKMSS
jgi:integrase